VTISRKVVLASANPHKLEELRAALPGWDVEALAREDYPAETGSSYRENATAKARFGRRYGAPEAWVVGEDSGIEVAALGSGPGVESARWAIDGVASLLAALAGEADRRARYVCVMVAVAPDGAEVVVEGALEGSIATGSPRGREGFGYDPIFVPEGETRTVAELGDDWKRASSHRARAAASLAQAFEHR
jgi:XTP/dITP diphosphohydrolase